MRLLISLLFLVITTFPVQAETLRYQGQHTQNPYTGDEPSGTVSGTAFVYPNAFPMGSILNTTVELTRVGDVDAPIRYEISSPTEVLVGFAPQDPEERLIIDDVAYLKTSGIYSVPFRNCCGPHIFRISFGSDLSEASIFADVYDGAISIDYNVSGVARNTTPIPLPFSGALLFSALAPFALIRFRRNQK